MQSFDFTGTRKTLAILGSGTSVGKTLCVLGLAKAFLTKQKSQEEKRDVTELVYLKPWQTGFPKDSDEGFVAAALGHPDGFKSHTISKHAAAVSPHLASKMEGTHHRDEDVLSALITVIHEVQNDSWILIEGAGGVLSPTSEGTPQADFFRRIRMPVLLVGDAKLGGISATLSAAESLHARGFDLSAVVMAGCELENHVYLKEKLKGHFHFEVPVFDFPDFEADLQSWILKTSGFFSELSQYLELYFLNQLNQNSVLIESGKKHVWWPFTQHSAHNSKLHNEKSKLFLSARGDWISAHEGNTLYDASASWWTQCLGHAPVHLARNLGYAAARYGHVMFPENFTEPTVKLCEHLVESVGKGWAQKCFLSDNGSTAVEVGLKMAFRLNEKRKHLSESSKSVKVLGLQNTYHGDTLGAMSAVAPSDFNATEPWYCSRGVFLKYPMIYQKWDLAKKQTWVVNWEDQEFFIECDPFEVDAACKITDRLRSLYSQYFLSELSNMQDVGCLILEPLAHGSGGMHLVHPVFQTMLIDFARQIRLPVLFDEVFVGLFRLGFEKSAQVLQRNPDISCYSKCLSGGMLSLGATLASQEVFEGFLGEDKKSALLHGHSYSGNPIAASVALESLRSLNHLESLRDSSSGEDFQMGRFGSDFLTEVLKSLAVIWAWSLGTVFAFKLKSSEEFKASGQGYHSSRGAQFSEELLKLDITARPLGDVVYLMLSQNSDTQDIETLEKKFLDVLGKIK
jgi:bifunctional dethiobiotin synthetase / adenosylmethionine---8-amino-7-oxononanoate aminotransferase